MSIEIIRLNLGIFNRHKRIQTSLSLFFGFGRDQSFPDTLALLIPTSCSGCRVQIWVKVWAYACYFVIPSEGYSRKELKVSTAKSSARLLEQC